MAPILGYWSIRGLAQPIRYLLHFTGTEFEEKLYEFGPPPTFDRSQWLDVKFTLGLQIPNIPYYIDGDLKLTESVAILRHLARKNQLAGTCEEDWIRIDVATGVIGDVWKAQVLVAYSDNYEQAKGSFMENVKTLLTKVSSLVGTNKFILGDKICFVDFMLLELLDRYEDFIPTCLQDFPNLKAFQQRVKALPAIKKYRDSPEFLKMADRFNGRRAKAGAGTY